MTLKKNPAAGKTLKIIYNIMCYIYVIYKYIT